MKKIFIIGIITIIVVCIVSGCLIYFYFRNKKPDKDPVQQDNSTTVPLDFKSLKLTENNCSAIVEVLEAEKTNNGIRLTRAYENISNDERTVVREINGDEALLNEVQTKLGQLKVEKWNGFKGSNPPDILDGTSMNFECTMSDGSRITAYGSNNFPKNYNEVHRYLFDMLYSEMLKSDVFKGECYEVTLPKSWVGKVKVTFEDDFNAFSIPLGDSQVLLMRIDYRRYELNDKSKLTRIGTIKKKGSDEELFLEVLDYGSYMKEDDGTPEQYEIYKSFNDDIKNIIDSIKLANGYEFVESEE